MNEKIQKLLIQLHELNHNIANEMMEEIQNNSKDFIFWDEFSLTKDEKESLKEIFKNAKTSSAIKKMLMDCTLSTFHDFFALIDGVCEPDLFDEEWFGLSLIDKDDDENSDEFLHDELYNTFWEWKKIKQNEDE